MRVVYGITGSVAASLAPKIVKGLLDSKHEVKVIATQRTSFFFKPEDAIPDLQDPEVAKYLVIPDHGRIEVLGDKYEWPTSGRYAKGDPVWHIAFGDWADLLLIAPITFNTTGKIANCVADNFLTSIVAEWPTEKPFIIAPAMNTRMWENPGISECLETISNRYQQFRSIGPVVGNLACGGVPSIGAMERVEKIIDLVNSFAA